MSKKRYVPENEEADVILPEEEVVEETPVQEVMPEVIAEVIPEIVPEAVVEVQEDDSVKISDVSEQSEPIPHEVVQEVVTEATGEEPTQSEIPEPAPRDYMAEAEQLMKAHPELTHTSVPDEVFRNCVEKEIPMLEAYDAYLIGQLKNDLEKAKLEIETLRHNAEAAMRAPVTGVKVGGMPEVEESDFLKGFMRA